MQVGVAKYVNSVSKPGLQTGMHTGRHTDRHVWTPLYGSWHAYEKKKKLLWRCLSTPLRRLSVSAIYLLVCFHLKANYVSDKVEMSAIHLD